MVNVRIFGVFRLDTGLKQMSAEAKTVRELLPMVLAEAKRQNPRADADMKALRGCIAVVNGKQASLGAAPSRWISDQTAKNNNGQRPVSCAAKAAFASGPRMRLTASTWPIRAAISPARGAIQASTGTVKPFLRPQGSAAGQARSSHLRSSHFP